MWSSNRVTQAGGRASILSCERRVPCLTWIPALAAAPPTTTQVKDRWQASRDDQGEKGRKSSAQPGNQAVGECRGRLGRAKKNHQAPSQPASQPATRPGQASAISQTLPPPSPASQHHPGLHFRHAHTYTPS
ncbi:uncharacterized protein PSFLO_01026 [Pseudozyma flocculosa]|uniref:Uncharacterized protein n=1 Tax=Pseudozyma flocculosa TaxID=84751 RepID=A0A5C3EV03_9BASI|nr:uncharacterized protein PSFLO_01026 [Pseudozyma flocculosa]